MKHKLQKRFLDTALADGSLCIDIREDCTECGGSTTGGSLTSECAGLRLSEETLRAISNGIINYYVDTGWYVKTACLWGK